MGAHSNCLAEAILMNTHNIDFMKKSAKLSFNFLQISSNTHLICSFDNYNTFLMYQVKTVHL